MGKFDWLKGKSSAPAIGKSPEGFRVNILVNTEPNIRVIFNSNLDGVRIADSSSNGQAVISQVSSLAHPAALTFYKGSILVHGPIAINCDQSVYNFPLNLIKDLHVEGLNLYYSSSSLSFIWKCFGVSAFSFLYDHANGNTGKLDSFLGALPYEVNSLVVFCMWDNLKFSPKGYKQYYQKLDLCLTYAEAKGKHVILNAFCDQIDGSSCLLSSAEQDSHLNQVVEVLKAHGTKHLLIYNNEDWANGNISARFGNYPGVLCCRSQAPNDQLPDQCGSLLDFLTYHSDRSSDWVRKTGKQILDDAVLGYDFNGTVWTPTGKPGIETEPIQDFNSTPIDNAVALALCYAYGAGYVVHGGFINQPSLLQNCEVNDVSKATLDACADVYEAMDGQQVDFSTWKYTRGGLDGFPIAHDDNLASRSYGLISPDGSDALTIVCQAQSNWEFKPINGWENAKVTELGCKYVNLLSK